MCEDTFVRLSYFFPRCKMGKIEKNDFCTPMIVIYRSYTYDYYYYDYDYYLRPLVEKERETDTLRAYIYLYIGPFSPHLVSFLFSSS
jgi:hypothetical protein